MSLRVDCGITQTVREHAVTVFASGFDSRMPPQRCAHVDGPVLHTDGGAGPTPASATTPPVPDVQLTLRRSDAVFDSRRGCQTRVR